MKSNGLLKPFYELFRFLSSVRLAVPLLLVLAAVVAAGTILESLYSASYAKLMVYDTLWFYALMALLGLNILFAALSRLPWKARHTGFVITHTGMLIMLTGAYITAKWGIDGELRVEEGSSESVVGLPGLQLTLANADEVLAQIDLPRSVRRLKAQDLEWLNEKLGHGIRFKSYEPFTLSEDEFVSAPDQAEAAPAVSLWFKSPFFNSGEWLHARDRADLQMGPARLRLIVDATNSPPAPGKAELRVYAKSGDELLETIKIETLKQHEVKVGDARIRLAKSFETASVEGNKIVEKGGGANPAVELLIATPQGQFREISFAHFKDFSLIKAPQFPFRFEYVRGRDNQGDANLIEVHLSPTNKIRMDLFKHGEMVLSQSVEEGSQVDTPWMGMKIFVAKILPLAVRKQVVRPLNSPGKGAMPPSALELNLASQPGQSFWLSEGDSLEIPTDSEVLQLRYDYKYMRLPFSVQLDRFVKDEYPGTAKARSFESHVTIPEANLASVISMNNPLARAGFTLYQSSFQSLPDRPPVSILSVNRDPGRYLKYLGGLVTSLGIVVYVLMKSRFWLWLRRPR